MGTKHKIFFVFFLNIFTIQATEVTELESSFDLVNRKLTCDNSGPKCLNCWTSLNCIDLKNGTFYPNLQYCPIGESCRSSTGTCDSQGHYECSDHGKLRCNTEGVFPSPFNSIEYFTCVKGPENTLLKFDSHCASTYTFDPYTKLCRKIQPREDLTPSLLSICKKENDTGSIFENNNIYFRCEMEPVDIGFNLVPQMHACPFDHIYNSQCEQSKGNVVKFNGLCFESKNYAHPLNQSLYFECRVGISPKMMSCPSDESFYSRLDGCYNTERYPYD